MKVAIFGRLFNESFTDSMKLMFDILNNRKVDILIYKPFYDFLKLDVNYSPKVSGFFTNYDDLDKNTDFVFTIGGDGTFLEAVTIVRDSNIPIVGINCGRLGFLADISQDEIPKALDDLFSNSYTIEKRSLLKVESSDKELFGDFNYALNEFTVHKKDSASMITVHTYLDEEYLNSYWADGLIISSPTGSTAYSLSVGGPILIPETQNFVISPISPHNLTVRPIVVSNNQVISLKVEGRSDSYLASLDSRSVFFKSGDTLKIQRSDFTIKVVKLEGHSFFGTLRNKLMWGVDRRN